MIRPVNWALGRFLPRLQPGLRPGDARPTARPWAGASASASIVLLVYVGLLGLTGFGFARIPSGFVPIQDKGYLIVNIQLPDSASLERTVEATAAVEKIALETPGVAHTVAIPGQSFVLNAISSNFGNMFVILKPFHERRDPVAHRRGHRWAVSAGACSGRSRRRACSSSGRRRCGAWATPAASS